MVTQFVKAADVILMSTVNAKPTQTMAAPLLILLNIAMTRLFAKWLLFNLIRLEDLEPVNIRMPQFVSGLTGRASAAALRSVIGLAAPINKFDKKEKNI